MSNVKLTNFNLIFLNYIVECPKIQMKIIKKNAWYSVVNFDMLIRFNENISTWVHAQLAQKILNGI